MNAVGDLEPAQVFTVGEYLADELEARGSTLADFAALIGCSPSELAEIVDGHVPMNEETAAQIGAATGTEPQTWLRIQAAHQVRHGGASNGR